MIIPKTIIQYFDALYCIVILNVNSAIDTDATLNDIIVD